MAKTLYLFSSLLMCTALVEVSGFTLSPSLRTSTTLRMCSASEHPDGVVRRDALRLFVGGGVAAFAGAVAPVVAPKLVDLSADIPRHMWERWDLVPAANAYVETKDELLMQAAQIEKAFAAMGVFLADVEKQANATEAQRNYYEIHQSLSNGAVSSLRTCCFHLYRNHVVNPTQFKEAEKQYKVVVKGVEKFSTKTLQASRNEIKGDDLKDISVILASLLTDFKKFVSIVTPA